MRVVYNAVATFGIAWTIEREEQIKDAVGIRGVLPWILTAFFIIRDGSLY